MSDPWDRPPLARRGNRSEASLFESIGRALNAWEMVEAEMAHLYSAFITLERFDLASNLAYGEPNTFPLRAAALQRSACPHFCRYPSQEIEGEFRRLITLAERYSVRRNDIAHGTVRPFEWVITPATQETVLQVVPWYEDCSWCLIPPHYRPKNTGRDRGPAYLFTSWEINEFGKVFMNIAHAISNLSIWVIQHAPPSPYICPRPSALPYKVRDPRTRRG
jgi:hypothetical protein